MANLAILPIIIPNNIAAPLYPRKNYKENKKDVPFRNVINIIYFDPVGKHDACD